MEPESAFGDKRLADRRSPSRRVELALQNRHGTPVCLGVLDRDSEGVSAEVASHATDVAKEQPLRLAAMKNRAGVWTGWGNVASQKICGTRIHFEPQLSELRREIGAKNRGFSISLPVVGR